MSSILWETLVAAALDVRRQAYAPYSKFQVGAALLAASGKIYTGCNVENVSYGLTQCAERAAVTAAVADGAREFRALALAVPEGKSPCGACRQVLAEFCSDLPILIVDATDPLQRTETNVAELLPHRFTGLV